MTAKEYLNQARHLDALINCRLREIDYWRDLSSSVSGSNFEPHYNPNKPTEAPFVRCLDKIDAIQKDVAENVAYLVCLKETINEAIDRLASREEQLVLRYRYLDNCSWEEISRMLNGTGSPQTGDSSNERVASHGTPYTWSGSAEFYHPGLKVGTVWHRMAHPSCAIITIAKQNTEQPSWEQSCEGFLYARRR